MQAPSQRTSDGIVLPSETIPKALIGFLEMSLPFLCGEDSQLMHLEQGMGNILEAEEGSR